MDAAVRERTVELSDPLSTAAGTIEERTVFLVRIEREGVTGVGEAAPLPGWTESAAECRDALAAAVECLHDDDGSSALDAVGATPAAAHGLQLATVDRAARAEGDPLYKHLGAWRDRESVPVNATIGDGDVDETTERAEAAVDAGFETLKVKAGVRSVSDDLDRLHAVRDAVGGDVALRVDANGAWTRAQAETVVEECRSIGVSYVEQPLSPDDLDGHAALRGEGVGIGVDESIREAGLDPVLAANAADAVVLKPMAVGGPRVAASQARRARSHGVDPVVTTTIDAVVARTAAVHVAAAIPFVLACGLATADRIATDLADDPAPVNDGRIRVPQSPGHGVEGAWEHGGSDE